MYIYSEVEKSWNDDVPTLILTCIILPSGMGVATSAMYSLYNIVCSSSLSILRFVFFTCLYTVSKSSYTMLMRSVSCYSLVSPALYDCKESCCLETYHAGTVIEIGFIG